MQLFLPKVGEKIFYKNPPMFFIYRFGAETLVSGMQ